MKGKVTYICGKEVMGVDILKRMPKVELHLHLDGSVRPATIMEIAAQEGISLPACDLESLTQLLMVQEDCRSLPDYLARFDLPLLCLQTEQALKRAAYEILEDAANDHVKYMEVRFAPALHTAKGLTPEQVIAAVLEGMREASRHYGVVARALVICMRNHSPQDNEQMVYAAKMFHGQGVAGVDLAGDEVHFGPGLHRHVFQLAHHLGLPVTIHAGEAAGPENIRESIQSMCAKRIGHGVQLQKDPELLELVVREGIPLEMCLTSNVQTRVVPGGASHPIRYYYDSGVKVTLNTDNTTVSNTTLTQELQKAAKLFAFTPQDIAAIMLNGLQAAFLEETEKARLRQEFEQAYRELGIPGFTQA